MPTTLRPIAPDDLPIFYEHQCDREAVQMAAFTSEDPEDRAQFDGHWARILPMESVTKRTVLVDEDVAGHIMSFNRDDAREVTFWLGRDHWGRGVASKALAQFLETAETTRPIEGRVAKDNAGSRRVLEKNGFEVAGEDRGYANARHAEIEEWILRRSS